MDGDRGEFEELEDELRQAVGGEFRRTAEEDEYAAAKAQLRARTLEHVAYELLARGDTVAVTIGADVVQGIVMHAKGDLLCLETASGDRCDVRLGAPAAIHVVQRATSPGRARDRFGAESFVARLRELELEEIPVMIVGPMRRDPVVGTIAAVASDHVLLRNDDGDWYLSLAGIAAVTVH
ncbi:MAG: hypothetical protein QNJ88_02130 [Acidimicrobiia bacterium]|nr:hypothetical protein [Acidimicrobiia bacterium]